MHRSQKTIAVNRPKSESVALQRGCTNVFLSVFYFILRAISDVYTDSAPRSCISLSASFPFLTIRERNFTVPKLQVIKFNRGIVRLFIYSCLTHLNYRQLWSVSTPMTSFQLGKEGVVLSCNILSEQLYQNKSRGCITE